jgi:queuosine precursor transporter
MNVFILISHILLVGAITLFALRLGKEAMIAWISLLALASNLFILKEITIFGLNATCTDSLAVGYLLGLNLIQEFFGQKAAKKTVWIAFFVVFAFLCLSFFQLSYKPSRFDDSQNHYSFLLQPIPRILVASLASFFLIQLMDLSFFAYLRKKFDGKYFPLRAILSSFLAESIDTILFTYLALYGTYESLGQLIIISFTIKVLTIFFSSPFLLFSKRFIYEPI